MAQKWIQNRKQLTIVLAVVLALVATGTGVFFWARGLQPKGPPQPIPVAANGNQGSTSAGSGLSAGTGGSVSPVSIHLSEGQAQPQAAAPIPVATGVPLSDEEVAQLLARLPDLPTEEGDQTGFKLAQGPIPPPKTGQTILDTFPPAAPSIPAAPVETGPLQVLRFAPEGEIKIAPFLSVTFNQPMVPLTTISELAAGESPVKLDPPLAGTWRWLGTRTLTFEYDSKLIDRLPKATVYHATVPAGTKSAAGGILDKAVEWTFSTPPPVATTTYPTGEPQPREPLFFIAFDQGIDPAAVLATIQVSAGGQKAGLKLVSEAELKADDQHKSLLDFAVEGRWLAFKATEPLPSDSNVTVTIGPGTPSAEGPLTTTAAQTYSFRTYAPLRIEEHGCSYGNDTCQPLAPFYIRFNNPIDEAVYTPEMLRIQPELPGAAINIYGNTINIQGASKAQTTYTVWVSANLQDIFGQKLGQEASLTFKVGPAQPILAGPGQAFITLDPSSKKPALSVYVLNYSTLDVKIYAVQPSDWPAYKTYLRDYQRTDIPAVKIPGKVVLDKSLPVETPADTLTEVNIDLSGVMDGSFGQFIVVVKPPSGLLQQNRNIAWQTVQAWVQVTQIGLDAFNDQSDLVVWATALKDGSPLAGLDISAEPGGQKITTGADGTSRGPIPDGATTYLVARQGADTALLPRSGDYWGDEPWARRMPYDELRWYVFDDRQMYRPGEEVHVKGWLRRIGSGQKGDVGPVSGLSGVSYQLTDSQGNEIGRGKADANALGGFDLAFTLPEAVNLGYAQLNFIAEGSLGGLNGLNFGHSFQIQEFRRPEFEVQARNETPGPYFAAEPATVAVTASYYAGGALPDAEVTWQVTSNPGHYAPPNWPDFTFGDWTPWWFMGDVYTRAKIYGGPIPNTGGGKVETFSGKTDATGTHYLQLDINQEGGTSPISVQAEATVMDVNRQAWTGTTTLLVHPASVYVGLRSATTFVQLGTPIKVDFIVTDLDGKPVADRPVEIKAARLEWKYSKGSWQEVEADVQTCQAGSKSEPGTCTFQTPVGGSYRITATVTDDKGRRNQSQFTRWVSGGKLPTTRRVEQEQATLIPDKETYQPGDTAQILVQSPFTPAEGLLTVNRSGIITTQRFHISDGTATLQIPIEEAYIPNLAIQVDLNGAAPRTDDQGQPVPDAPLRPAYASGTLTLNIPPLQRTLALKVTPAQSELEPGGETSLDLVLKDAHGQPVSGAELAVVVVDEAILALSNYQMADPLGTFYTQRSADLTSVYGRASIILTDPQALANASRQSVVAETQLVSKAESLSGAMPALPAAAPTSSPAAMDAAGNRAFGAAQPEPIRVRSDFNPLAVFAPAVRTGADGTARVTVKVPDNLTRYRVMVVAVDASGKQFGQAESNLVARLPLMVRPSAPRFLNFGDQFDLPVVLQNQTGAPLVVDVVVRASNLSLTGQNSARLTIPARNRIEVRFPAAAQMAGTARIQIAAVSGTYSDAATIQLPVYTPATTEAFATYGVIDSGATAQPVAAPGGVFSQFGGLEITTSSTAVQALTDAVLYLTTYPYDCSEQMASRILAIASLRDVLTAFKAQGLPSPAELQASVGQDLTNLGGLQNDDGGFPYWRRGDDSVPFNTIHVAHALVMAGAKGYSVPADMLSRVMDYLRQIESHYPSWYDTSIRQTLSAYALFVRNQAGDRDPDKALKLLNDAGLDGLSLDAIGWLWPVIEDAPAGKGKLDEIRRYVANKVVETAGAANFTTHYDDQNYLLLGSDRRTDAILLNALMGDNPQSDLIPKVVNGLLAHRSRGRWMNTQENVFVLLALDKYFNTFEAQTPDFTARIWLGDGYAGEAVFQGRTTDQHQTNIPMAYLLTAIPKGGTQALTLSKEGDGRLYYRLGLTYAPTDLRLPALDMGFVVQRVYEAVDNPEDVSRNPDGTWQIKAGARVRVRLTMSADNRRYHVALDDPLPAGLEIVNPDLAVAGSVPQDPSSPDYRYGWWWWGTWYEHQNLRDERAEAFTSLLWEGVYTYTYLARATTPGTFVVPPTKAEEMYSPEVFGRSASDIVVIK